MNKRAEGTASSFFIVIIISLAVLVSISLLVNSMLDEYRLYDTDLDSVNEFENFSRIQEDFETQVDDVVESQDNQNISDMSLPERFMSRVQDIFDNKVFNTIRLIPATIGYGTRTISESFRIIGKSFPIPAPIKWMIYSLISVTVIFLVISIIRRYNKT